MDDELLKLECLKTVIDKGLRGDEALRQANDVFDWLKGRGRHAKIGGAKQPVTENEHVKVHGRVEDGIPGSVEGVRDRIFTDYLKSDPDNPRSRQNWTDGA